jgi:molybdopterin-guanine dinucleotide biosynthesis protein A
MTEEKAERQPELTLTAVLLTGGESRRMGRDKAMLVFRGQPLWQRQLELLRTLCPERIFVSARAEPPWLPPDAELLLDEAPSCGPLSGLTRALAAMPTSHLVVLAVDMPFMTSQQMRTLWSLATNGCGVLPMIGDRAEPLGAIYPREAMNDLLAALEGNDFSLQHLSRSLLQADKLRAFQISLGEQELYRSVNEPGDIKERPFPNRPSGSVGGLETAAP